MKNRKLFPFELKDQEERIHRYEYRNNLPVVLVVSGRNAVPVNKEWDKWFTGAFEDKVIIYRILDLSDVPGLFRSYAVSQIKKGVEPPGLPILLDWEGKFIPAFNLKKESTNVLVADTNGVIRCIVCGRPEGDLTVEVSKAIKEITF